MINWLLSLFKKEETPKPTRLIASELAFASETRKKEYEAQLATLQQDEWTSLLLKEKALRIAPLVNELIRPVKAKARASDSDQPDDRHTYTLKLSQHTAWLYTHGNLLPSHTLVYDSTKDTEQDLALMIATKILSSHTFYRDSLGHIK